MARKTSPVNSAGPEKKHYMTPAGYAVLDKELHHLLYTERPKIVEIVAWAAGNGDRSENGDYIYNKKRLREIDRRVRFLSKRLDIAEVVDNAGRKHEKVFFGATVTYATPAGDERTVTIVGVDEIGSGDERVSWRSPLASALLKAKVDDVVVLRTPRGPERLTIVDIRYDPVP